MENTKTKSLHPLLAAAAISLIVFSAVGVAALTGLLPASKGEPQAVAFEVPEKKPEAQPELPLEPVIQKVEKKKVVRAARPAPAPEPVALPVPYEAAPPVLAEAPRQVEAPKPVELPGVTGTIESVREVKELGQGKGIGAVAGGVLGAVLGHQVGEGSGKKLATVLGGAAGAFGGHQAERKVRETSHWEIDVRLDDGTRRTLTSQSAPYWRGGERVRLHEGRLTPA